MAIIKMLKIIAHVKFRHDHNPYSSLEILCLVCARDCNSKQNKEKIMKLACGDIYLLSNFTFQ